MIKKTQLYTLDFWVITFMFAVCAAFLFFSEIIPSDFLIKENYFKNNSQYIYKKDLHRMMLCSNAFYSDKLEKYYQDPELLFEESAYLFKSKFKNKKTALVIIDNVYLVVHRYTKASFWDFIFSIPFRTSQAYRAWSNGLILIKQGIHSTKPLIVIEKRVGPYCTSSYLVTNYITGLQGTQFFKENSAFKEKWEDAAENIKEMLKKLDSSKIKHLNFSLNNFIVKDETPYLIDLELLRKYRFKTFFSKKNISSSYLSALENELINLNSDAHLIFHDQSLVSSL